METPTTPLALCFEEPRLQAIARFAAVAAPEQHKSADFAPANLFIWNHVYRHELAFFGDHVIVRVRAADGSHRFLCPVGTGDLAPVVEALRAECRTKGYPLVLVGVTDEQLERLEREMPDSFTAVENRDAEDYIYSAEKLSTLSGKKLHAKRNHINAFCEKHSWRISPLRQRHFDACRAIVDGWQDEQNNTSAEREAIERALSHFEELGLCGALLRVDDRPVAFAIGEMLGEDTLCVHFEKALSDWREAYPVINREFVRMVAAAHPALALVNREDDMGLENLRRAKLSWRPAYLLRKHTLTFS